MFQWVDQPVWISIALPVIFFPSKKRLSTASPFLYGAWMTIASRSAHCSMRICDRSLPSSKRWKGVSRYVPVLETISIFPIWKVEPSSYQSLEVSRDQ